MSYKGNQITWGRLAQSLKATITNALNAITNHESVKASSTTLGHIKADGTTITVDPVTGIASAKAGDKDIYVQAISTNGSDYDVTIEGVTELVDGLTFTVKPNMTNTDWVYLNVNGLGKQYITHAAQGLIHVGLFQKDSPYTVRYNGKYFVMQTGYFGLVDSLDSTSKHFAASAYAVKQVNDKFKIERINAVLGKGWITSPIPEAHPLTYFKDAFGVVHMYGNVKKMENLSLVTTMPEGFRPTRTMEFMAQHGASQFKPLFIFADGRVESYYNDVDTNIIVNVSYPTT